ncbi:MAG: malto-oligosyltrehalose synthase [Rhodanobacteraceae bacterium]
MTTPRATVRLQFNREFTLTDALGVVDYYADLGISHFYASPLQHARSDSTHGYDVVDYRQIDPKLGGIDALRELVAKLRTRDMGLILDVVPNHMATSEENAWWFDVLEHGHTSRHAQCFDIDWHPRDPALRDKVLLPFLAGPLAQSLSDMRICCRHGDRRLLLAIDNRSYPLAPESYPHVLDRESDECARDVARYNETIRTNPRLLMQLLERQHWLLADWREASRRINWRRFFDIADLIALRIDRRDVFDAVHELVFRLFADGLIDGVRIDHVDGIADPRIYCERLREGFRRAAPEREPGFIVVEKILAHDERLPPDWPVEGTTGYDFMDQCSAVLHDSGGGAALSAMWVQTGGEPDFDGCQRAARSEIAQSLFAADIDRLIEEWCASKGPPHNASLAPGRMRDAVIRLLRAFSIYRTYLEPGRGDERETGRLRATFDRARMDAPHATRTALDDLEARVLAGSVEADHELTGARLLRTLQQLTPPIAAKAVEDTAFYRYGRLLSRNEVGSDPAHLALSRTRFHAACEARYRNRPAALLATATHDHKRGEDMRARLAVLSQIVDAWACLARRWRNSNADLRIVIAGDPAPSAEDEYMLLQMLVGAWPFSLGCNDAVGLAALITRVSAWQTKALREKKCETSWLAPNSEYETACETYLRRAVAQGRPMLDELIEFVERIAPLGMINSLAQTVLRLTTPGVPDLYQGCDYWDFSLVDPDNRKPVDYASRRITLTAPEPALSPTNWQQDALKQRVIARLLGVRARNPDLWRAGDYRPLSIRGSLEQKAIAFARVHESCTAIVIATRLAAHHLDRVPRIVPAAWADTEVCLDIAERGFVDVFSRRKHRVDAGKLKLCEVLTALPVAVLLQA